jgi:hypothetical protein
MIRHGVTRLDLPTYWDRTFAIKKIFQHPNYIGTAYYDIAVIQIAPIEFHRNLSPICLPDPSKFKIDQYDDKTATLIGWGQEEISGQTSQTLKRSLLTIYEYR